jgi:hypothetical protein
MKMKLSQNCSHNFPTRKLQSKATMKLSIISSSNAFTAALLVAMAPWTQQSSFLASAVTEYDCTWTGSFEYHEIATSTDEEWALYSLRSTYNDIHHTYNDDFEASAEYQVSWSNTPAPAPQTYDASTEGGGIVECDTCNAWDDELQVEDEDEPLPTTAGPWTQMTNRERWEAGWCDQMDQGPPPDNFHGANSCVIVLDCGTRGRGIVEAELNKLRWFEISTLTKKEKERIGIYEFGENPKAEDGVGATIAKQGVFETIAETVAETIATMIV